MKKVNCYVDIFDTRLSRTGSFQSFCRLFMLLGVWDVTTVRDSKIHTFIREWTVKNLK